MNKALLICLFCLCLLFDSALPRGGKGVGGRGSRGYSSSKGSKGSKSRGGKVARKFSPKIPLKALVPIAAVYLLTRPRFRTRSPAPLYESDYVYFESIDLDPTFNVNNNKLHTPFILPYSKDLLFDCLVVSRNTKRRDCPRVFRKHVTNTTKFNFPNEFNITAGSVKRSTREIALCCGCLTLIPSLINMAALAVLALKSVW